MATAARSVIASGMWDYFILLTVAVAGLWGGQWWLILMGSVGLCFDGFLHKWKMLKAHPLVPFDLKVASVFFVSFGNALFVSSVSYVLGRIAGLITFFPS